MCTVTHTTSLRPTIFQQEDDTPTKHAGMKGIAWKMARVGERLSQYVALACFSMAIHLLFIKA